MGFAIWNNNSTRIGQPVTSGTAGDNLYIDSNGNLAQEIYRPMWTLLQTLTPFGVTNVTTAALTAYAQYLVVVKNLTASSTDPLAIQFNADSGNHYYYTYITNVTTTQAAAQSSMSIAQNTANSNNNLMILVGGNTGAGTLIPVSVTAPEQANAGVLYFGGVWSAATAIQVATMKFLTAATNITGTIEIWGRN